MNFNKNLLRELVKNTLIQIYFFCFQVRIFNWTTKNQNNNMVLSLNTVTIDHSALLGKFLVYSENFHETNPSEGSSDIKPFLESQRIHLCVQNLHQRIICRSSSHILDKVTLKKAYKPWTWCLDSLYGYVLWRYHNLYLQCNNVRLICHHQNVPLELRTNLNWQKQSFYVMK